MSRVLTVKVEPTTEQWRRLRDLAWQAMQYRNSIVRARWADMMGLRAADALEDKNGVTKKIRARDKNELSSAVYDAAETEVKAVLQRDGKKILSGAPLPQWRQNDSLAVRDTGIRVEHAEGRFWLHLAVQSTKCEGGCWMRLPIAQGREIDDFQHPLLLAMASGETKPRKVVLAFKLRRGKTLARITYGKEIDLPAPGERVVTVGPATKDGRLFARSETDTLDLSHDLSMFRQRKADWDLIVRRVKAQIGRHRGAARKKREAIANLGFDQWTRTWVHQVSAKVAKWAQGQLAGRVVLLDVGGGDWPAHEFASKLAYKLENYGITLDDQQAATLEDASTERAARAEARRKQQKAKDLGDAARTLRAALS